MRAYVLTDAALTKQAGRFAWLTIDSEKSKNTAFVEKFPVDAWPMFLVIDPKTEKALLKWSGSATAPAAWSSTRRWRACLQGRWQWARRRAGASRPAEWRG